MEQPTKEEVERWKSESACLAQSTMERHDRFINLCDAYLALREEKEARAQFKTAMEANDESMFRLWTNYCELKAENEALKEEADQLNSDMRYYKSVAENQTGLKLKLQAENQALQGSLVEQRQRMQEEYDGLLDRMAGYRKADADEIKRLKEENQGLRAQLNVLEA